MVLEISLRIRIMSARKDVQKVNQMYLVQKLQRTSSYSLVKALCAKLLLLKTSFLKRQVGRFN